MAKVVCCCFLFFFLSEGSLHVLCSRYFRSAAFSEGPVNVLADGNSFFCCVHFPVESPLINPPKFPCGA